MNNQVFWITLIIVLLLGAMAIAAAILYVSAGRQERTMYPASTAWHVEMWNIRDGYQVDLRFFNTCVLGRMSLYDNIVSRFPPQTDPTISREHCMLYEQDGMLFAGNLSAVNPAAINGFRLNIPRQVIPGDRVELGNSVFLVTRVERI